MRQDFCFPTFKHHQEYVYLCGHSLGLMPKNTRHDIQQELDNWAQLGVLGHFEGEKPWLHYHNFATPHLAKLAGCRPDEVVAMGSLTTNIHLLLAAFYQPKGKRNKILIEPLAFGSDVYAVSSQIRWHGLDPDSCILYAGENSEDPTVYLENIKSIFEKLGDEIALVFMGGVQYFTGQLLDIASITSLAHQYGAIAGFDLAHAMGNVPLYLHDWQVDFATWCSYKYLNSGPGAVGGIFVHDNHAHNNDLTKLEGWWGNSIEDRFEMNRKFIPSYGAEAWQQSNAPVLSICAHLASLKQFEKEGYVLGMSVNAEYLNTYLRSGLKNNLNPLNYTIITPSEKGSFGCQLSIRLKNHSSKDVEHQLIQNGVICDARHPDIIRVSAVPLYNNEEDIDFFVKQFSTIINE